MPLGLFLINMAGLQHIIRFDVSTTVDVLML